VLRKSGVATQKHLAQIIRTSFKCAAAVRRCFNVVDDLKVDTKAYQPDNVVRFDTDERWPALDLIKAKRERSCGETICEEATNAVVTNRRSPSAEGPGCHAQWKPVGKNKV
jgi:hypothetical protein